MGNTVPEMLPGYIGRAEQLAEIYADEGEVDFLKIMRILRDSPLSMSICHAHMPTHPVGSREVARLCVRVRLFQGTHRRGELRGLSRKIY